MAIFKARNAINGKCCKALATINGEVFDLCWIKTFDANVEKSKTDVPVMGDIWMQKKSGGVSGSGSMTVYYCSPVFRDMITRFINSHVDEYFTMTVINDDESSSAGVQAVVFNDVNIDGCSAGKFDVTTDALEEDISFTFSGVEYISKFNTNLT